MLKLTQTSALKLSNLHHCHLLILSKVEKNTFFQQKRSSLPIFWLAPASIFDHFKPNKNPSICRLHPRRGNLNLCPAHAILDISFQNVLSKFRQKKNAWKKNRPTAIGHPGEKLLKMATAKFCSWEKWNWLGSIDFLPIPSFFCRPLMLCVTVCSAGTKGPNRRQKDETDQMNQIFEGCKMFDPWIEKVVLICNGLKKKRYEIA